jgi:hypothetical protein
MNTKETMKKLRAAFFCTLLSMCTLMLSATSHAASIGGTWEVVANGASLQLNITSIDAQGHFTGTLVEGTRFDPVTGFWSESSKKITFVRTINNPAVIQVFTGYLLNAGATFCDVGEFRHMMAGSFEAFASTGGTAARSLFGWTARQCVVG